MVGIATWYPGKFADAVARHHRNKHLLIISVTFSEVNQTEDTMLQDTLLNSFDFGDVKLLAVKVQLDSVGGNRKVFAETFPDVDSPGIIFVSIDEKGESKIHEKLPSICDLNESAGPIIQEYKQNYVKFLEGHPDFESDHEEIVPVEEKSLEERKKEVREAIAKAREIKSKQEEEQELEREIKRREDGKKALEMQEKIKEINQQRDLEKRRLEKEADARRLKELRELERRDKEERARRKAEAQGLVQPASSTPAPAAEIKPQQIASDECRICYQFPNGSRVIKVFKSSAKFSEVYDAIKDDPQTGGNYKLFTTFPRKAIEEYSKSLLELCLTPASALAVVKSEAEMQVVTQGMGYLKNAIMMMFTMIGGPIASIIQFFSVLLGLHVENPNQPERRVPEQRQPKRQSRNQDQGRGFKNDGRFQRLNDDESSDNEGTWNGNSTQQL